jgi:hypothetical protein
MAPRLIDAAWRAAGHDRVLRQNGTPAPCAGATLGRRAARRGESSQAALDDGRVSGRFRITLANVS